MYFLYLPSRVPAVARHCRQLAIILKSGDYFFQKARKNAIKSYKIFDVVMKKMHLATTLAINCNFPAGTLLVTHNKKTRIVSNPALEFGFRLNESVTTDIIHQIFTDFVPDCKQMGKSDNLEPYTHSRPNDYKFEFGHWSRDF